MTTQLKANNEAHHRTVVFTLHLLTCLEILAVDNLIIEGNNVFTKDVFDIHFIVKDTQHTRDVLGYGDGTNWFNETILDGVSVFTFTTFTRYDRISVADIHRLRMVLKTVKSNLIFEDAPNPTGVAYEATRTDIGEIIIRYNFKDGERLALMQARLNRYSVEYFNQKINDVLPEYQNAFIQYEEEVAKLDYENDYGKAKRREMDLKRRLLDVYVTRLMRAGVPHTRSRLDKKVNKNK